MASHSNAAGGLMSTAPEATKWKRGFRIGFQRRNAAGVFELFWKRGLRSDHVHLGGYISLARGWCPIDEYLFARRT